MGKRTREVDVFLVGPFDLLDRRTVAVDVDEKNYEVM